MAPTRKRATAAGNPFWISFSDLMAGLLFVFILIFAVTILAFQEEQESMEAERAARENITKKIVAMLLDQFQTEYDYPVEINQETGTLTVSEGVLFEFNEAVLTDDGQAFLQDFIPKYCTILFQIPEIGEEIAAVIVEGHTDEIGSYQFNMGLSLRRAYSVVEYIYDSDRFAEFAYKTTLQQKLSANGRSKIELKETPVLSRRVEFKFRLRDIDAFETAIDDVEPSK